MMNGSNNYGHRVQFPIQRRSAPPISNFVLYIIDAFLLSPQSHFYIIYHRCTFVSSHKIFLLFFGIYFMWIFVSNTWSNFMNSKFNLFILIRILIWFIFFITSTKIKIYESSYLLNQMNLLTSQMKNLNIAPLFYLKLIVIQRTTAGLPINSMSNWGSCRLYRYFI